MGNPAKDYRPAKQKTSIIARAMEKRLASFGLWSLSSQTGHCGSIVFYYGYGTCYVKITYQTPGLGFPPRHDYGMIKSPGTGKSQLELLALVNSGFTIQTKGLTPEGGSWQFQMLHSFNITATKL